MSGDAHTGHTIESIQVQNPFVQTAILWLHPENGQAMFAVSQALPSLGMDEGQGGNGAGGVSQNQTGVPKGWPPH